METTETTEAPTQTHSIQLTTAERTAWDGHKSMVQIKRINLQRDPTTGLVKMLLFSQKINSSPVFIQMSPAEARKLGRLLTQFR